MSVAGLTQSFQYFFIGGVTSGVILYILLFMPTITIEMQKAGMPKIYVSNTK